MRRTVIVVLALAGFAFLWRVVPHDFNMTPMGALALFAGAYLRQPLARVLVPLATLVASDLILGFHDTALYVYGAFAVIALGGVLLRQRGLLAHTGGAVAAALLFYAVTNFGVWAAGVLYPADASGLLASYAAGLPFLWKTLAGNVFFTVLFFAVFQLVERYQPHTQSTESR
jgi:hypothetical protein